MAPLDPLLGRNRRHAALIVAAGVLSAGLRWALLAQGIGPRPGLSAVLSWVLVIPVAVSAATSYWNRGLLACWGYSFALLLGLVYTPYAEYVQVGWDVAASNLLGPSAALSLGGATLLGTFGFLLGAGVRRVVRGPADDRAAMSVLLVGRSPIDIAFAVALGSGVALLVGIVWVTVGAPLTVSPPRDLGDPVLVGAVVLVAAAVGAGDGGLFPAVLAAVLPSAAVFATPALAERGPPIAHVAVEAVWYGALVAVPFAPIGYVLGIGVATVRRRIRPGTPAP